MMQSEKKWWIAVTIAAVVLIGIRMALPGWIRDYLNRGLDRMGSYHGRVEDVDVALWGGAYTLKDVRITKYTETIPVPFMAADRIALSISWRALLNHEPVAIAEFHHPVLNFVDDKGSATQSGLGVDWQKELEALAPFRVDEVHVQDGTVHFRNFSTEPEVDLQANHLQGELRNLSDIQHASDRAAECVLTGQVLEQAPLELSCAADPTDVLQDFQLQLKLTDIELTRLNEFLRAYANVDVESGEGDFVMELDARDGQLSGYAKPVFGNVRIFDWEHDIEQQGDSPFRALWESLWGGVENLFKNQDNDQIATRVEIHGEIGDAQTSTGQAIAGILKNAFVEAYKPRFDNLPE